jgi:hypothetical protein
MSRNEASGFNGGTSSKTMTFAEKTLNGMTKVSEEYELNNEVDKFIYNRTGN